MNGHGYTVFILYYLKFNIQKNCSGYMDIAIYAINIASIPSFMYDWEVWKLASNLSLYMDKINTASPMNIKKVYNVSAKSFERCMINGKKLKNIAMIMNREDIVAEFSIPIIFGTVILLKSPSRSSISFVISLDNVAKKAGIDSITGMIKPPMDMPPYIKRRAVKNAIITLPLNPLFLYLNSYASIKISDVEYIKSIGII